MESSRPLIVGAGPIGLACAISARRRGLEPLVVDAGPIAASIVRYPVGMTFFTTPERLEIGGHPLVCSGAKATREEALKYYRGVARAEGIRVRTYTRLVGATLAHGRLEARVATRLGEERIPCSRLVLATGYFEHPNLIGVPGEDLPHVSHYAEEPHLAAGQDVVIVGGKNSAVEHALSCYRAGARVTLVYRREELRPSVKYWLQPDLVNRIKAGEIAARFGRTVERIDGGSVTISGKGENLGNGERETLPADRVYLLTGYHPDFSLFAAIGIEQDDESCRPRLDPLTLETNIPGVYLAGSATAGRNTSEVFIENGRYDGEKIFGDAESRARAEQAYQVEGRGVGE
ncbi:MAG TPA: YpdA family putative bacillithiol disulfide reductase [Gemmatimonadales bacterium]|nr:YpdA family putative bacillithiol disulfide reductase [Gemmatimonadales bacterium]